MRFNTHYVLFIVLLFIASCQAPLRQHSCETSTALNLPLQETPDLTATPAATPTPDLTNPTATWTPGPQAYMPLVERGVTLAPTPIFNPTTVSLQLEPLPGTLSRPIGITSAGDGSGRLFIIEKAGIIRLRRDGVLSPDAFLDIRHLIKSDEFEQGLLGLAFHPRYKENGFFYVNYTDVQGNTMVARYSVSDDEDRADPASASPVLSLAQPEHYHNGGHLAFGPDGYLWIATGDGGGGDASNNGQRVTTLLGKILRININSSQPYTVPPTNPFVGIPGHQPEIWAYGLRNPWRFSFDRLTNDLYIADVGQDAWEEINFSPAGAAGGVNYGWNRMEGVHCYPPGQGCDPTGLTLPVAEYPHSEGCSVTGGYVYRGHASPLLRGAYLFGDFCTGRIWSLHRNAEGVWIRTELAQTGQNITAFGEDEQGEIYVVNYSAGTLSRLVGAPR